eukprot:SM000001S04604  [mRNA]  locus=s1:1092830:1095606:- [translate_table: standard]
MCFHGRAPPAPRVPCPGMSATSSSVRDDSDELSLELSGKNSIDTPVLAETEISTEYGTEQAALEDQQGASDDHQVDSALGLDVAAPVSEEEKEPRVQVDLSSSSKKTPSPTLLTLLEEGWFTSNVAWPKSSRDVLSPIQENQENKYEESEASRDEQRAPDGNGPTLPRQRKERYGRKPRLSRSLEDVRWATMQGSDSRRHVRPALRARRTRSMSADVCMGRSTQKQQESAYPEKAKSLTDADIEELRGFFDLGFKVTGSVPLEIYTSVGKFDQSVISPRMASTLPALRLYQAVETVQQRILRQQTLPGRLQNADSPPMSPAKSEGDASYSDTQSEDLPRFCRQSLDSLSSSPPKEEPWIVPDHSNHPAAMKQHLRMWAQTVACTLRQAG